MLFSLYSLSSLRSRTPLYSPLPLCLPLPLYPLLPGMIFNTRGCVEVRSSCVLGIVFDTYVCGKSKKLSSLVFRLSSFYYLCPTQRC